MRKFLLVIFNILILGCSTLKDTDKLEYTSDNIVTQSSNDINNLVDNSSNDPSIKNLLLTDRLSKSLLNQLINTLDTYTNALKQDYDIDLSKMDPYMKKYLRNNGWLEITFLYISPTIDTYFLLKIELFQSLEKAIIRLPILESGIITRDNKSDIFVFNTEAQMLAVPENYDSIYQFISLYSYALNNSQLKVTFTKRHTEFYIVNDQEHNILKMLKLTSLTTSYPPLLMLTNDSVDDNNLHIETYIKIK